MTDITIQLDENWKLIGILPKEMNLLQAKGFFRTVSQLERIFGDTQTSATGGVNVVKTSGIKRRPVTKEEKETIVNLYYSQGDKTIGEISKIVGRPWTTVSKVIKKYIQKDKEEGSLNASINETC